VSLAVASREAGLSVKARDGKGNDLEADVLVDGQKVGTTPGRFKVSVCAKEAEVRHSKEGSVKKALSLREREVTSLEVELKGGVAPGVADGMIRIPVAPEVAGGMVRIPAGEFLMGCSPGDGECGDDEKPKHEVWVSEFFLDATEVTVASFGKCVQAGECSAPNTGRKCNWSAPGKEAHPVNCVDWNQAKSFCAWAGKRLPTEAEWEKAARGGKNGSRYGDLDAIAWYNENSGGGTQPVGKKQPNAFGLYDMLGNVWEWCSDWYDKGYYKESPGRDPKGPSSGQYRVLRGGSWFHESWDVRASLRYVNHPGHWTVYYGFRCAGSAAIGP
jgi:formylglycine-generating enzyme required for sulfatase activity